ncbi:MAG TPA: elongation factor G, partial [Alphaproteobacteria bacterium]|nr:elongation factor G [Alphaproteobacteria bacterium]
MMADADGRVSGPRCIALVGPFASGKTSLLEAILMRTGAITRQGRIADRNTLGDASAEARVHMMSVEPNIAETEFMGDRYTFIDCPGSIEFQAQSGPVLAGADLAVVVAEADSKKLPALQVILRDLEARKLPHLMFLNKIDKSEGSVREVLTLLQRASAVPLVLRQIPLRSGGAITGFIDLAQERAHIYREGKDSEIVTIPEGELTREHEARFSMLEKIADFDDTLMEQLLEDIEPERTLVFADLVKELRAGLICPVFIGAAEHGYGVGRLLKALRHEAPGIATTRERLGYDANGAGAVQVLRTMQTTHGGKLSVVRVLAGEVRDGAPLHSPAGESKPAGIFRLMGAETQKREAAQAGETVALGKLEHARTGDTLYLAASRDAEALVQLAPLEEVEPVMALAIAPRERKDDVRLSAALAKVLEEDPSLRLRHVQETGETVLEGHGEMHLRVTVERLTSKYGVPVTTATPRIAYRETIRRPVSKRGRHKKQSGGHGQFGDVVLTIEPRERGSGIAFFETITGGVVPRQYFSSVENGVREYLESGGPLGFPVVDVAVTLTDGSYHTVDSSDMAFKQAARLAMAEGMPEASPVLLEPVM